MAIEVAGDAVEDERRATKSQLSDHAESCSGNEKAICASILTLILDFLARELEW